MMHLYLCKLEDFIYNKDVLILVVMDDALVLCLSLKTAFLYLSLNPCCNG